MSDAQLQQRICLRMAVYLAERLTAAAAFPPTVLPEAGWHVCRRLARLLELAHHRTWRGAARRLYWQLESELRRLRRELDQALPPQPPRAAPGPSSADVYRELVGLHEEFEEVELNLRQRSISVVTEPIELDGVLLGRFRIRLELEGGQSVPEYRVLAIDPKPAASSENTTHPHVRDEHLCEGDGKPAIRLALEQGRLCDFFQIVQNVLATYNGGSAFVPLEDWGGTPCVDCSALVGDDERCWCEACSSTICSDCARACGGCSHDHCADCIGPCPECDDAYCHSCMQSCAGCRRRCCTACLIEGLCPSCSEAVEEDLSTPARSLLQNGPSVQFASSEFRPLPSREEST